MNPYARRGDSPAQREQILRREAERVLKFVAANTYLVLLDLEGQMVTSEQLADRISDLGLRGKKRYHLCYRRFPGCRFRFEAAGRLAAGPISHDLHPSVDSADLDGTTVPCLHYYPQ